MSIPPVRVVVLSSDPADGNPPAWQEALRRAGALAEVLTGSPPRLPAADLVIAHLLLAAGRPPGPAWAAADRYEAAGTRLLNSTACLRRCADKWTTFETWRNAGLPQPPTWRLDQLATWPGGGEMLVKPVVGESARGIVVVQDARAAARAAADHGPMLLQQIIPVRSVLRVHATRREVLGAYARPAARIPGLPEPDPSERAEPVSGELRELATAAVRAVGGGLLGLDILATGGGHLLLEANPSFLVPAHLPALTRRLAQAVMAQAP